jgi:hypothetical protein
VRPPAGAPAGSVEISGRSVRGDTGGSVSGANVVAIGPSGTLTATSDPQGNWRFVGLQGGTYSLVATAPNFTSDPVQVDATDQQTVADMIISMTPQSP